MTKGTGINERMRKYDDLEAVNSKQDLLWQPLGTISNYTSRDPNDLD